MIKIRIPEIVKGIALAVAGAAGGWFANGQTAEADLVYFYRAQIAIDRPISGPGLPTYDRADIVGYIEGYSDKKVVEEDLVLNGYGEGAYVFKITSQYRVKAEKPARVVRKEEHIQ